MQACELNVIGKRGFVESRASVPEGNWLVMLEDSMAHHVWRRSSEVAIRAPPADASVIARPAVLTYGWQRVLGD